MQEQNHPRRVLVRLPNWVGDAVMATAALRTLKAAYAGAEIVALGKGSVLRLLAGSPSIDRAVPLPPGNGLGALLKTTSIVRALRPDIAVVMPNSHAAVLPVWLARVPVRAGYLRGRSWLLTTGLPVVWESERRKPVPMPSYYLDLVAHLTGVRGDPALELAVTEPEAARARDLKKQLDIEVDEPYAVLNPGASFGTSKLWRADRFAEVARELYVRRGWRSLVLCGPGEEAFAHEVAELGGTCVIDTSVRLVPLELLKLFLRDARVVITTDAGPRHIAVAFARPVVVLMGPTDPRYTAINLERTVVVREDVYCGPCHKRVCDLDHRCMELLDVPRVLRAVEYVLGEVKTLASP